MVKVIKNIAQMQAFSDNTRKKKRSIGFVPTMGYLHEGHISLVKEARKNNDIVVVSIFVNPAQFGPKEDLNKYPRNFSGDIKMLQKENVDVVFYPCAEDMYPSGYKTYVEVKDLSEKLCGASRPGHFRGVATVVLKLFNIVRPNNAYFGLKDRQQQVIIRQMVKDLNMNINIVSLPTIRERSGLAKSSRNNYLDDGQKMSAAVISSALDMAGSMIKKGVKSPQKIRSAMVKLIRSRKGIRIDYISICDPLILEERKRINGKTLIAVAAFVGRTRLIDNKVV